jgi:hypothetical protein
MFYGLEGQKIKHTHYGINVEGLTLGKDYEISKRRGYFFLDSRRFWK